MRRDYLICLLLAGITFGLYWPTGSFDLIYFDDPLFVTDNAEINSGINWHSLKWACSNVVAANWHPLTNLTFLFTHQFWGINPGIEHLLNGLIHAANACLLFGLLRRMICLNEKSPAQQARVLWRCAVVAAIFAWHPLRVESVAWIAERKDVLCVFFSLLTLLCWTRWAKRDECDVMCEKNLRSRITHHASFFWLALIFFTLALLSKPMAVTLPFVMLLLDVWPLNRVTITGGKVPGWRAVVREKLPFFALTLGFCALTYWVQKTGAAVSTTERIGWNVRGENIVMSYLRYLDDGLWPQNLAILYPFPVNERCYLAIWPAWQIIAGIFCLIAISLLTLKQVTRRGYLFAGWFWYLGTIVPVIGLVQVGGQGMADRYTYFPLIGITIALVWLIGDTLKSKLSHAIVSLLTIILLGALLIKTHRQIYFWRDSVALFGHTVDVTGDNFLGQLIISDGYDHQNNTRMAAVHARIAIAIYPTDKQGHETLARLLAKDHQWQAAANSYQAALAIEPADANLHLGLAEALIKMGKPNEAMEHLESALSANSSSPEILNNLAWTLSTNDDPKLRNGKRAVQLAQQACESSHYQKTIYLGTLAAAYAEAGEFDEAIATAQRACELATKNGETNLLQRNQELLELYRTHKPAREK